MGVSDNANQLVCVTRMEFTSEKFEASDRRPSVYDTFDLVEGLERAGKEEPATFFRFTTFRLLQQHPECRCAD